MPGANPEQMRALQKKRWDDYVVPLTKVCASCKVEKLREEFSPVKGKRLRQPYCRPCAAEIQKQRRAALGLQEARRRERKYYVNNREHYLAKMRRDREARKAKVFAIYGEVCVCCGQTGRDFLTIDHINNDGKEDRLAHGVGTTFYAWLSKQPRLPDYQTLCYNCNHAKQNNGGVCPHQSMKAKESA